MPNSHPADSPNLPNINSLITSMADVYNTSFPILTFFSRFKYNSSFLRDHNSKVLSIMTFFIKYLLLIN